MVFAVSYAVCVPFTYRLLLGNTLNFRLQLHFNFFSRRTNLTPIFSLRAVCSHASPTTQEHMGYAGSCSPWQDFPSPAESLPWLGSPTCAGMAQDTAQRGKE